MKSNRLEADVALVTGAASGLDREIAIEMSRHGAVVACADIDEAGLETTVNMITQEGGSGFPVIMDVGDSQSVKDGVQLVAEREGKISILINGAAVSRFSQLPECSDEEWNFVLNINLTGPFRLLREVYPVMKETGGRVVQISSTSAKSGGSWSGAHYVASKAGLIGLTKYAAGYFLKDKIRVNTICPGIADTPLTAAGDPEVRAKQVAGVPMGRFALPSDIAGVVMFLVSDESEYVTGITVDVTGGRYIYGN